MPPHIVQQLCFLGGSVSTKAGWRKMILTDEVEVGKGGRCCREDIFQR